MSTWTKHLGEFFLGNFAYIQHFQEQGKPPGRSKYDNKII